MTPADTDDAARNHNPARAADDTPFAHPDTTRVTVDPADQLRTPSERVARRAASGSNYATPDRGDFAR